jgi:hypothetical protein
VAERLDDADVRSQEATSDGREGLPVTGGEEPVRRGR